LTAFISGRWASDNTSEIFLNGRPTDIKNVWPGFLDWTYFTIESGFEEGVNTLEFIVNNAPASEANPTGLLVLDLTGTAAQVPIPGAVWLLGSALIALVGIKRRLRA
jgi:hypothetical protein